MIAGESAETEQLNQRLPSLDGWRAMSIAMVLGEHCRHVAGFPSALEPLFYWAFDGDLGVRIFFLISGLLITWLLLQEDERSGSVNLAHFYARRALRILPVYWVFLLVLATLQWLTPFEQSASGWLANLTFTTNFQEGEIATTGHLWSLAVEEQFYLLWPSLFLFAVAGGKFRRSSWILAVPILAAPVVRVVSYLQMAPAPVSALFSGRSFLKYFDSVAIGCVCAVVLKSHAGVLRLWLEKHSRRVTAIAMSLALGPYLMTKLLVGAVVTVPFGPSLQAVGVAVLLVHSVIDPERGLYRILNHGLVVQVGVLSYSIYIWQQLFCTRPEVFGWGPVWFMSFPTWLVAVAIVSLASYYGLERPLFRLRAKLRS